MSVNEIINKQKYEDKIIILNILILRGVDIISLTFNKLNLSTCKFHCNQFHILKVLLFFKLT